MENDSHKIWNKLNWQVRRSAAEARVGQYLYQWKLLLLLTLSVEYYEMYLRCSDGTYTSHTSVSYFQMIETPTYRQQPHKSIENVITCKCLAEACAYLGLDSKVSGTNRLATNKKVFDLSVAVKSKPEVAKNRMIYHSHEFDLVRFSRIEYKSGAAGVCEQLEVAAFLALAIYLLWFVKHIPKDLTCAFISAQKMSVSNKKITLSAACH